MMEKYKKAGLIQWVREGFPTKGRAEPGEVWRGLERVTPMKDLGKALKTLGKKG